MRADRLVSLVLLLRQRGLLSAATIAQELEVSTRTVLRDIEALSVAGVPVYAERGRYGGFALLPGFRAELTGLNPDEVLALLTAGSARGGAIFGLGTALAAATRKVVDALPASSQAPAVEAAQRFLLDPEADLLSRRHDVERIPAPIMTELRAAVLAGRKLRISYAAVDREPTWRTVDPLGLVSVRGRGYLLAAVNGADRTFRLNRVLAADALAEAAERPPQADLAQLWRERAAAFLADVDPFIVQVRLRRVRRREIADTVVAVLSEEGGAAGWMLMNVAFQDLEHAVWALWQLDTDAEALAPASLRSALSERAAVLLSRYGDTSRLLPREEELPPEHQGGEDRERRCKVQCDEQPAPGHPPQDHANDPKRRHGDDAEQG